MARLGQTYTSPQGAIAQLTQQTGQKYGTTVGAPPPNAQPITAPQDQSQPDQTTGLQGPTSLVNTGNQPDMQALASARAQMIDQLFQHDQQLNQIYSNPQGSNYIENPAARSQAVSGVTGSDINMIDSLNQLLRAGIKPKLTAAEQKQAYMTQMAQDIQSNPNASLTEVVKAYAPYIGVNDIVDAFSANNPTGQLDYNELKTLGYKMPTDTTNAQKDYQNAQLAMKAIDDLDKASKNAQRWYGLAYAIPGIKNLMGSQDPAASYQTSKMAVAQELTKLIYGSNYPGVAKNIQDMIPDVYASEDVRQQHINELKQEAMNRMQTAQDRAGTIALGGSSPMANMAMTQPTQPTTAMQPTQPATAYQIVPIVTSSGNQFSVVPGGL